MNFNIKTYIASGIIEDYCLGIAAPNAAEDLEEKCRLYPQLREEVEKTRKALTLFDNEYAFSFATENAKAPRPGLLDLVLGAVDNERLGEVEFNRSTGKLAEYIDVYENSDVKKWEKLTEKIAIPDAPVYMHELYRDKKRSLEIVWAKSGFSVPEEVHTDIFENFFILRGTCECKIGDKTYQLSSGSFLPIPLHVIHSLRVTSKEPVKLILTKSMVG